MAVQSDPPVSIKQYGKFWDILEASVNTMVAADYFVLGRP